MDHLDRPSNPVSDPIKGAYVCLAPYDNEAFVDYPLRRGYRLPNATDCDFCRTGPDGGVVYDDLPTLQSFLQAWLFFGLLREVHQMAALPFDQGDYISQDDLVLSSIRRINTSQLPHRLNLWKERFLSLPLDEMVDSVRKFDACLNTTYKICYKLVMSSQSFVDERLLLCFISLGNPLDSAMGIIFWDCYHKHLGDEEGNRLPPWLPAQRRWNAPHLLFNNMAGRGWCPFEIRVFKEHFQTNEMIYASQISRVGGRQKHHLCHAEACIANNVDEATYETRHEASCDGKCKDVILDYEHICSIVREGNTPLVVSVETPEGIRFAVTSNHSDQLPARMQNPRTGKMPYVCISHVWGHGLGNTQRNALPRCQMEMLHKHTSPLLTSDNRPFSVFWMDTICVPVDPADKALRQQAIANMASIYQEAFCVLVLDESLMQTFAHADPSKKLTFKVEDLIDQRELSIRIILSDWWRRLWTLQEGILCHSFLIDFAEGPVQINNAVVRRADDHSSNLAHASSPIVTKMLLNLVNRRHAPQSLEYHRQVLTLVSNRSTSRAADEPVCLGTLLSVDVSQILQISGDSDGEKRTQRMKKLYELLGRIPAAIVFLPGSRLDMDGFRWAPDTLIGASGPGMSFMSAVEEENGEAIITTDGLQLRAKGYRLASLGASLQSNFFILPGAPGTLYADDDVLRIFDGTDAPGRTVTAVVPGGLKAPPVFQGRGVHYSDDDLVDPVLITTSDRRIDIFQTHAILASSAREGPDGRWHARFLCPVHCYTNSFAMLSSKGSSSIRERLKSERSAVWKGERTGLVAWRKDPEPIMDWCIS